MMKKHWGWLIAFMLLAQVAAAQSLGELARKERERKAQQEKASVKVSTDELKAGKLDLSTPLDPARKGDLEYLLQQLAHPKASPDLLAAFVPHKAPAIPRLASLLGSTDTLKRVAPATVLTVLGDSQGVAAMASLLTEATEQAAAAAAGDEQTPEETFRQRMEAAREADYALVATKLGVWRFTEGSTLTPEQVVERLRNGPPVEIVGGPDNGQRIFNRAFRAQDENLRRGALALIRLAAGGNDFGYQADKPAEQNEAAIQDMTTFLTTERGKVISQIGTRKK